MNSRLASHRTILFTAAIAILALKVCALCPLTIAASVEVEPSDSHHVVRLNSDQPYVAGYHVSHSDFSRYEQIAAAEVTVSFLSTDPSGFPPGSWLGGGMFLQAQDTRFLHVDYGFYMILVLDSDGMMFIDLGLHQTREASLPLHTPNMKTIYTSTWRLSGLQTCDNITLSASWSDSRHVRYSVATQQGNLLVETVDVQSQPDCENIMGAFYAGNVIVEPFPFSRYVNYFQFGVTSSTAIPNDSWSVLISEPKMQKDQSWHTAEKAWSTEGDASYLDADWRWGGEPYFGVTAEANDRSDQDRLQLIFRYNGTTLPTGAVLWDSEKTDSGALVGDMPPNTSIAILLAVCVLPMLVRYVVLREIKKEIPLYTKASPE